MTSTSAELGFGMAAIGRPAYITGDRARDLGDPAARSVAEMRARAHELLDAAWDLGIRYIDAARSYGLAEEFLGSWLAQHPGRRAHLRVGSKWGYAYVGGWRMDATVHETKTHSLAMLETQWPETLAALGGAPDWYLIHSVTPDSPALADGALRERMRRLRDAGTRVGLSTSGPRQGAVIEEALAIRDTPFDVVQATWNLLEPSAEPALQRAADAGWTVIVKEVLANGDLADRAEDAFAAALHKPWADIVLSGAVTPDQLRRGVAAQGRTLSGDVVFPAALAPEEYWRRRSARPWA